MDLSHSERRQDVSNLPRPNAGMFSLTMALTKNYVKKKNPFLCLVFFNTQSKQFATLTLGTNHLFEELDHRNNLLMLLAIESVLFSGYSV